MNDYLSKPFDENQLLQVISRCLGAEMSVLEKPKSRLTPKCFMISAKSMKYQREASHLSIRWLPCLLSRACFGKEIRDSYDSKNFSEWEGRAPV